MARSEALNLYRTMLREAEKFPDFNFRNYFQRRIRDAFKNAATIEDAAVAEAELKRARIDLGLLQRQAAIGHMFDPHVKLPVNK